MPFVQAKCPECGGILAVDDNLKAAVCQFCNNAFIVQEAVNNYNTYNITNHNYGEGAVVNVYENKNSVSALIERVFMFLGDGEWESADEYCEKALDLEPKCAEAYLGKMMVEMQVRKQEQILNSQRPLREYKNFEKAVLFAEGELKAKLLEYEAKVQEAVTLAKYNNLKERTNKARSVFEWKELAVLFNGISSFNDSKELSAKCVNIADLVEKKDALEEIIAKDEEIEEKLIDENGVGCEWKIFKYTFGRGVFWIIAIVLAFFTYSEFIYGLGNQCNWDLNAFSNHFHSTGDYICLLLASVLPLIIVLGILEFVFSLLKRIFFNNNSEIRSISDKISDNTKKLKEIENEIASISF